MWIQQTVAERHSRFSTVFGKNNFADLYTKYLNAATRNHHTQTMAFHFAEGWAIEAPKLHIVYSEDDLCPCVKVLCVALNRNTSMTRYHREAPMPNKGVNVSERPTSEEYRQHVNKLSGQTVGRKRSGNQDTARGYNGEAYMLNSTINTADVRQQVFWGSKWGVLLHHLSGSTLIFRPIAGVSCVTGLRHGVTMHPRGDI